MKTLLSLFGIEKALLRPRSGCLWIIILVVVDEFVERDVDEDEWPAAAMVVKM